MPAKASWLLNVPAILDSLAALDTPVLDRGAIERIFRVGRRRAIQLLNAFGGYQSGRTFLIEKRILVEHLEAIRDGQEFTYEQRRRVRLVETLEKARRHRAGAGVRLPVPAGALSSKMADLAAGVRLEPGRLTVDFASPEDLLAKLFGLAQAAANDWERFEAAAGQPSSRI